MDQRLLQILDSSHVSSPTRRVLYDRLHAVQPIAQPYTPKTITHEAFRTLQQVIARLLLEDVDADDASVGGDEKNPRLASSRIAERLEESRSTGQGNGWRYASLPNDADALALGLQYLEGTSTVEYDAPFCSLTADQQEALLARIQHGQIDWPGFDAARWFEELLADATELYVSNPDVMVHAGFAPFADNPDGWSQIGLDSKQSWEPDTDLPLTGTESRRR